MDLRPKQYKSCLISSMISTYPVGKLTLTKRSMSLEDHYTLALTLKLFCCNASMSMVGNIPKIVGSLLYCMEMITYDGKVNVKAYSNST